MLDSEGNVEKSRLSQKNIKRLVKAARKAIIISRSADPLTGLTVQILASGGQGGITTKFMTKF